MGKEKTSNEISKKGNLRLVTSMSGKGFDIINEDAEIIASSNREYLNLLHKTESGKQVVYLELLTNQ